MTKHKIQVTGRFNKIYGQLLRLQAQHSERFRGCEYKVVKQKNEKDHARYLNLLSLTGPDQDTLNLLEEYESTWADYPPSFWNRPELVNTPLYGAPPDLNSQAQIVGHYLQACSDGA